MEDALISPEGLSILSGAGLIAADKNKPIYQHMTETIDIGDIDISKIADSEISIPLSETAYLPSDKGSNFAYVMFMKDGEIITEPFIPVHGEDTKTLVIKDHDMYEHVVDSEGEAHPDKAYDVLGFPYDDDTGLALFDAVLVDYYTARQSGAQQMEITADKFGGNFYLEASTLFRNTDGVDMPAEFIIPNCKVQSNFTFTMASSGDPSTFTFTMDAFPDYTRFDHSHKVLAVIQTIQYEAEDELHRHSTKHEDAHDAMHW